MYTALHLSGKGTVCCGDEEYTHFRVPSMCWYCNRTLLALALQGCVMLQKLVHSHRVTSRFGYRQKGKSSLILKISLEWVSLSFLSIEQRETLTQPIQK